MWSLLPSSQAPAFNPILSEMDTGYTTPTFHEDQVLYNLPSTTMCRSKESIKLRSPGEYFLITLLQWEVVTK